MKKLLPIAVLLFCCFFTAACSMQARRYLGYRLHPDKTPKKTEREVAVEGLTAPATIYFDR